MNATTGAVWDDERHDPFADPSPRGRRLWRWLPLVLGLVVFELTANPMLGVVVACLRFGESDLATAWWLFRRDQNRARAWACAAFHLAGGCFLVLMMSLFALLLCAVLPLLAAVAMGKWLLIPGEQIQAASFTLVGALAGVLASCIIGLIAAKLGGVKVWASRSTHGSRRRGEWPPRGHFGFPEANRVLSILAIACVLMTVLIAFLVAMRVRQVGLPPPIAGLIDPLLFLIGLGVDLVIVSSARSWLMAKSPSECWPDEEAIPAP